MEKGTDLSLENKSVPLFPFRSTANPLWELSSFSEAAKAVGQAMKMVKGIL